MNDQPDVTNIQRIHSIGSFPWGKAAGTLSSDKNKAAPSFSHVTKFGSQIKGKDGYAKVTIN